MDPIGWWRWWRRLPQNPVFLREKGNWGTPNPYYATIRRYSPFVIMGAILFGLCAGTSNISLFSALDEELIVIWCLLCLPGALLSMFTIFGSFMAPALTAPAISLEKVRGTWDILRMTPQSTRSILMAKLFGALARLRIWPVMLLLTFFQGLIVSCIAIVVAESGFGSALSIGIALMSRPWLEIIFAAFMGMFLSTSVKSATVALASSYGAIILMKLINSSALWGIIVMSLMESEPSVPLMIAFSGPAMTYILGIGLLWFGIQRQAQQLNEE